jgi:hypothetical protein
MADRGAARLAPDSREMFDLHCAVVAEMNGTAVAWMQRNAKGYWIVGDGKLVFSLHAPSLWERFVGFLNDETWVPYK